MHNITERLGRSIVEKYATEFETAWSTVREKFNFEGMEEAGKVNDTLGAKTETKPKASIASNKIELNAAVSTSEAIAEFLVGGGQVSNINQLRSAIAKHTGKEIKPGTVQAKEADEIAEVGVVMAARKMIQDGESRGMTNREVFDSLIDLYQRQPNLAVRDSISMRQQAYSTPVPLAYLVAVEARVTPDDLVYDPTAGNGALLVAADKRIANELNERRAEALRSQGIETTTEDATEFTPKQKFTVLAANPPFGKDPDNPKKTWVVDGRTVGEIDHATVLRALGELPEDGRAVLIIGSKGFEQSKPKEDAKRAGAYSSQKSFYDKLYRKYNVTDHYTVDGGLYSKQGAKFPIDVLVIDGKGESARPLPYDFINNGLPQVFTSWKDLGDARIDRLDVRGPEASSTDRKGDSDSIETGRNASDLGPGARETAATTELDGENKSQSQGNLRAGMGDEDGRAADARGGTGGTRDVSPVPGNADVSGARSKGVPKDNKAERGSSPADRPQQGSDAVPGRSELDASDFQAKYEPASGLPQCSYAGTEKPPRRGRQAGGIAGSICDLDAFVAKEPESSVTRSQTCSSRAG